jgi:pimeloyl-ACP methyl ester carboxylesterase
VGAEDRLTPPSDAEEVAALIPGSRLAVIPGAGHGLMVEAAPDFNAAVLAFLATAGQPAGEQIAASQLSL